MKICAFDDFSLIVEAGENFQSQVAFEGWLERPVQQHVWSGCYVSDLESDALGDPGDCVHSFLTQFNHGSGADSSEMPRGVTSSMTVSDTVGPGAKPGEAAN